MFEKLTYFQGLSNEALKELEREIRWVHMPVGRLTVFDNQGLSQFIHFPLTAVCSVDAVFDGEAPVQLMIFGSNTIVGSAINAFGFRPKELRTSVLIAGNGGQIPTYVFNRIREKHPQIDRRLVNLAMRFTWNLAAETACSMTHAATQRIAERIAKIDLLVRGARFAATPTLLAQSIGCSRTTAHNVMASLKAAGAIEVTDLNVKVCDRLALDKVACGCSRQVADEPGNQLSLPIGEDDHVFSS
jgi:hypothetical protein